MKFYLKLGLAWRVAICFMIAPLAAAQAQLPVRKHIGTKAGENFGYEVAGLGDIDADGFPDYAVGSPAWKNSANQSVGKATVYSGRTGTVLWSEEGITPGDRFGWSIAGDAGVIAIGAPGRTDLCSCSQTTCTRTPGYVYLFESDGDPIAVVTRGDGAGTGYSVDLVGDLTGDGISEVIAGAPFSYLDFHNTSTIGPCGFFPQGSIVVLNGATGAMIVERIGTRYGHRFGFKVAGVGNVDNAGNKDFAAIDAFATTGATAESAMLKVFSGTAPYSVLHQRAINENPLDVPYHYLTKIGKANGDQCDDFAYLNANLNQISLISGSCGAFANIAAINKPPGSTSLLAVAGTASVDGDASADLIVGVSYFPNPNQAQFISGSSFLTLGSVSSPLIGGFGTALNSLRGDLNGDGKADLIVGAFGDDNVVANDGSAYIYVSPSGSVCSPTPTLYLQNGTVGSVQSYAANSAIEAGRAVTGGTQGDYLVSSSGALSLTAGGSIRLAPGFAVQSGGALSALIQPGICP